MRYDLGWVSKVTNVEAMARGRLLAEAGLVTTFDETERGFAARVVDDRDGRVCRTTVAWEPDRGLPGTPWCDCAGKEGCAHVAAMLWEGLRRWRVGTGIEADVAPATDAPSTSTKVHGDLRPGGNVPQMLRASHADRWMRRQGMRRHGYPLGERRRIAYDVSYDDTGLSPRGIDIEETVAALRHDGKGYEGPAIRHRIGRSMVVEPYVTPADEAVTALLAASQARDDSAIDKLAIDAAIRTGRARWSKTGTGRGRVDMKAGDPRPTRVSWGNDGRNVFPVFTVEPAAKVLDTRPPCYVDEDTGEFGEALMDLTPDEASALVSMPAIPAEKARGVNEDLRIRGVTRRALLPVIERTRDIVSWPTASIRLGADRFGRPEVRTDVLYEGIRIDVKAEGDTAEWLDGNVLNVVHRNRKSEAAQLRRARSVGLPTLADPAWGRERWFAFILDRLPQLRGKDWDIEVEAGFPHAVDAADVFQAEIRRAGTDWFELGLGVEIGGVRVDASGAVASLLGDAQAMEAGKRAGRFYLPLPGGRHLAVDAAVIEPLARAVAEMMDAGASAAPDGRIRLKPVDAASLAEFEGGNPGLEWRGEKELRSLGRRLTGGRGDDAPRIPGWFRAKLRPYQAHGVAWMHMLHAAGLGGVLADDMGLGKTVQALAFLAALKSAGRLEGQALVVAPTSLMGNWAEEAARFAPELKCFMAHGRRRPERDAGMSGRDADVVFTTYGLAARDAEAICSRPWGVVLLDEAQAIKNRQAGVTKAVGRIRAGARFCLSGTPVENHLGELWSVMDFAAPGLLGEYRTFAKRIRGPIESGGDERKSALLSRRVKPFLLRRTKEEVAKDLPPKVEVREIVTFEEDQRAFYDGIRLAMHEKVREAVARKGFRKSSLDVIEALLRMRQACCHPALARGAAGAGAPTTSAKFERLEEMVTTLAREGRRTLVFSQFTSMLDIIEPALAARGITTARLTGETRDRPAAVAAFRSGEARVFLISLKAGGTGLNLIEADNVIIYDPWWNPAVEAQAVDRAHRIGRTGTVFVHRLIAAGTVEEKMEVLKARKAGLAAGIYDAGGEVAEALTEADVDWLFGE